MSTAAAPIERLDAFASQATFRVLLEGISRPGSLHRLDTPWGGAVVPLALADVETTIAVVGDDSLAEQLLMATGATLVPLEEGELVAFAVSPTAATVGRLRQGSPLAPEGGAKVGVDCRRLTAGTAEVTLTLRGPGVDGTTTLGVDGVAREVFAAFADANRAAPAGIDVWLVDDGGQVAALPRTCHLEVH